MAIGAYGRRLSDALELQVVGAFQSVRFGRQKQPDLERTLQVMRTAPGRRRLLTMEEDIRRWEIFFRSVRKSERN